MIERIAKEHYFRLLRFIIVIYNDHVRLSPGRSRRGGGFIRAAQSGTRQGRVIFVFLRQRHSGET